MSIFIEADTDPGGFIEPDPALPFDLPETPGRASCLCGCGETPLSPTAKYMRGHVNRVKKPAGVGRHPGPAPRKSRKTQAKDAGAAAGLAQKRTSDLIGFFSAAGFAVGIVGARSQSLALTADAITISQHAAPLSVALVETAENNERFARIIDMLTAAGPYAALFSAVLPLGLQIGTNHGAVPPIPEIGTVSPHDLVEGAMGHGGPDES